MAVPRDVDSFVDAIRTQDTHKRLKLADDLTSFLSDPESNVSGVERLIDGLTIWAGSSNFKISVNGLQLLGMVCVLMGTNFQRNISNALSTVVDRLGDAKQQVREEAQGLLIKFISPCSNPQYVFELLPNYFNHKNFRVREELMLCLVNTINRFGSQSIQINKLTPQILKLTSDPNSQVRDTATKTLVEIYRHVGERVRTDLAKRNIPEAKLNSIFAKFDEVQRSGKMVFNSQTDQTDGCNGTPAAREKVKVPKSAAVRRSTSFTAGEKRKPAMDRQPSGGGGSGAVDENDFIAAWEDMPLSRAISNKDVAAELEKINSCLSNANNDWEKRVDALKQLRALGKLQVDNFAKMLRDLEVALRTSAKDLRSQVVREACVTLSYLSNQYEGQFDYLAEAMLPTLISLIPNSVKIMATSGHACIRLIIKNTPSARLIPIIVSSLLTSKSKEIRRRSADYMDLFLEVWDTSFLKNHVAILEEAIRKGIADADSECRAAVRRAYWHFADHYKNRADNLMQSFDSSKQKLLNSDKNLLQAGLTRPKANYGAATGKPVRSASSTRAGASSVKKQSGSKLETPVLPMQRSASQLDYKSLKNTKMAPRQKSCDDFRRDVKARTSAREGRHRVGHRSATSQPSSRHGSPKRVAMPSYSRERSEDYMKIQSPLKTRIPTPAKSASHSGSRQASREPSPTRPQMQYGMRYHNGTPSGSNLLAASSDGYVTEDALWDALKRSGRREGRHMSASSDGQNIGSDESDTSSLCSNRSKDELSKRNLTQDYNEILALLQSNDSNNKRDGLVSLQAYLHGLMTMSAGEAIAIKETFNRYFAEPNSKIYSLFLDVVSEFIVQYKHDLSDWLFVLLTRLLHRLATDLLPSSQSKNARVLDIVRDSYPYDHQFQIITKYITDNTQTPSLKMKVAILQYMRGLIALMDPSDFVNSTAIRLAVSRIITWISEPKSADVRKEAASVIVALFELNTPEFSMMLANLPNSIQEGATRILQTHIKPSSNNMPAHSGYDSVTPVSGRKNNAQYSYEQQLSGYPTSEEYSASPMRYQHDRRDVVDSPSSMSRVPVASRPNFSPNYEESPPFTYPSRSIKADPPPIFPALTPQQTQPHQNQNETDASRWLTRDTMNAPYNPNKYEETLLAGDNEDTTLNDSKQFGDIQGYVDAASDNMYSGSSTDLVNQITMILTSSADEADSDRVKSTLLELLKMLRARDLILDTLTLKQMIPHLLALLKHKEGTIRCLSARGLREVASGHPDSYINNLSAFILPLLETEADVQKEVAKTAEECCTIIAQQLRPEISLPIVGPIAGDGQYPRNLSAIKMINIITEKCSKDIMIRYIDVVIGNLLKAYDHDHSSVRKAAVFSIVAIHNLAGAEVVTPFFKELAGSKMKLLSLYIRRSQTASV